MRKALSFLIQIEKERGLDSKKYHNETNRYYLRCFLKCIVSFMGNRLISIVVPVYNRKDLICRTLASIYQQEVDVELDVVVVDDGSTDDTDVVVRTHYPQVRLIKKTNGGASSARNHGVKHAKSELVAFCDSDDLMLPGRLQIQYGFLIENPSVIISAGNFLDFNSRDGVSKDCRFNHEPFGINAGHSGVARDFLGNCIKVGNPLFSTGMFKKSVFLKCGGFSENLQSCEDFELRARIANYGDVGIIDRPLMLIRNDGQDRLSGTCYDYNPYELMVDHWLNSYSCLFGENEAFACHVRQWAGHVVLQSYTNGDLSSFSKIFRKYRTILTKKQVGKCLVAWAFLSLSGKS